MNRIGRKTRIVVSVEASTAVHTLFTPSTAARNRSRPCRRLSSMLSMTTMLLSSVMPIANATPASEMTLIVRPAASNPRNAAIVQTGMPSTPTTVARADRRKRNITEVANSAPSARFSQTFRMDASTYPASSAISCMRMPLGCSTSRLTRSTASSIAYLMSITFEPASRLTDVNSIGSPLKYA